IPGMSMSRRRTSGRTSGASRMASSADAASATTSRSGPAIAWRMAERTRAWSSTSITRMFWCATSGLPGGPGRATDARLGGGVRSSHRLGLAFERDLDADGCPVLGRGRHLDGGADQVRAFGHALQPVSADARRGRIEALPVVAHGQDEVAVLPLRVHAYECRIRVLANVVERLLDDPHQLGLAADGQPRKVPIECELRPQTEPLTEV